MDLEGSASILQRAQALLDGPGPDAPGQALRVANRLERCAPEAEGLAALEERIGQVVLSEAGELAAAGDYAVARGHVARFLARLDLAEALRELELEWAAQDRAALHEDEAAGRLASAFVRSALVAGLSRARADLLERQRLAGRLSGHCGLSISQQTAGETPLFPQLDEAMDQAFPPGCAVAWVGDAQGARISAILEPTEPVCSQRSVARVAEQGVAQPSLAEQRQAAQVQLEQARQRLVEAAQESRRLRGALQAMDDAEPSRRAQRWMEAELVQAVLQAEQELAALEESARQGDGDVLRYEVSDWIRTCQGTVLLSLSVLDGETSRIELSVASHTRDSAHPAIPEHGIDEDPLVFPLDDQALLQRVERRLARDTLAQLQSYVSAQIQPPNLTDLPPTPEQLDEAACQALRVWLWKPAQHQRLVGGFLREHFQIDDLDWLGVRPRQCQDRPGSSRGG